MLTAAIQNDFRSDQDWGELPPDLLRAYVFEDLNFNELYKMSTVCKMWFKIVADNTTGAKFIKAACLQVESKDSWMHEYSKFVKTPQILVLDVSGSMSYLYKNTSSRCSTVALLVIDQLLSKLSASIRYGGIECIAFEGGISRKKCKTAPSAMKFFKEGYTKKKFRIQRNQLQYTTNITLLFEALHEIHKEYSEVTCQATIISDFDDSKMNIKTLAGKRSNVHIQCINLGEEKVLLENLLVDYEKLSTEDAHLQHNQDLRQSKINRFENRQRKYFATSFGSASHSAKKQYRIRDKAIKTFASLKANPKKRKQDVCLRTEYEFPLQLTNVNIEMGLTGVNLDGWKVVQKKRKISIL